MQFLAYFLKNHGPFVIRQPPGQILPIQIECFHKSTGLLRGKEVLLGKKINYGTLGKERNLERVHVLPGRSRSLDIVCPEQAEKFGFFGIIA